MFAAVDQNQIIKRARKCDRAKVVNILAEAFEENKSVNYVVKQDVHRKRRIRKLMEYSFDVCNSFGEVWISNNSQACALLLLPDQKRITLNTILWDLRLAFSVIGIERVGAVLSRESKIKAFHPKQPFTYLWFIGVIPDEQAKGIGSRVIEQVITESERRKRPIYLETSVERNLRWYKKFGFEVFHTIDLSYRLYLMSRATSDTASS